MFPVVKPIAKAVGSEWKSPFVSRIFFHIQVELQSPTIVCCCVGVDATIVCLFRGGFFKQYF